MSQIPKQLLRYCPPGICPEDVWRGLGIRQSPGWVIATSVGDPNADLYLLFRWEMYMRHDPVSHRTFPRAECQWLTNPQEPVSQSSYLRPSIRTLHLLYRLAGQRLISQNAMLTTLLSARSPVPTTEEL